MPKVINMIKKSGVFVAAGATTALTSVSAFAEDHSAAIAAAGTDATGNVTAAVVVVLGIVAVVAGVGFIVKLLGR